MARTTRAKVEAIIEKRDRRKDLVTDTFILPASNLVTRLCVPAGYDEETLELIERYLAAHFYTVTARRLLDEWTGQGRGRVEDKVDFGLRLTWYGQQALVLDTAGALTAASATVQKVKVGITWMGDGDYERDYTK